MRPIPLILRVGLFAAGVGAGMSHFGPPSTPRTIIIEVHGTNQESVKQEYITAASAPSHSPCSVPVSPPLSAGNVF